MTSESRRRRSHPRVTFDEVPAEDDDESSSSWFDSLVGLLMASTACICLFGLLTMLCILFVTTRPFSETMYRRLGAQMGLGSFLDALALLLPNMKISFDD